jgi:hypothetical protein
MDRLGDIEEKRRIFPHNQQRMEKLLCFLLKGFLWKICNLEITLPLKSFVGLREEKPPISQ